MVFINAAPAQYVFLFLLLETQLFKKLGLRPGTYKLLLLSTTSKPPLLSSVSFSTHKRAASPFAISITAASKDLDRGI